MSKINIFKKIYRILNKFLLIIFSKVISQFLKPLGLIIVPSYDKIKNFAYYFSPLSRRLIFYPKYLNLMWALSPILVMPIPKTLKI